MRNRRWVRTVRGGRTLGPRGFTLAELMITVAVLVVLVIIATPSLNEATLGNRLTAYSTRLMVSAYLARGEAIKRNVLVTLCASANGTDCATTGGWEQGWIVRCPSHDDATNPDRICCPTSDGVNCATITTGAPIVFLRQPALQSAYKVVAPAAGDPYPLSLIFQPTSVGTTQATLKFCRASPLGKHERQVSIGATGGASIKRTTTGTCS